jgi:predicted nucleic acid-binding protein
MSDYLLDTNVLIRCLRRIPGSVALLQSLQAHSELHISVLSRLEVLARMWPDEEQITLQLLTSLSGLPVDEETADSAGRLVFQQARRGLALNVPDAIIAATAMRYGLILVSYDTHHFAQMPDLQVLEPDP